MFFTREFGDISNQCVELLNLLHAMPCHWYTYLTSLSYVATKLHQFSTLDIRLTSLLNINVQPISQLPYMSYNTVPYLPVV